MRLATSVATSLTPSPFVALVLSLALATGASATSPAQQDSARAAVVGWRTDGTGNYPLAQPPTEWSQTRHVVWSTAMPSWSNSSPIVVGDQLYFVSSLGILSSLDAASGKELWQHRLGGNYAASPIAADGKLYFTSQEGVTIVLRPGPEYVELARNQLIGQSMASPTRRPSRALPTGARIETFSALPSASRG